MFPSYLEVEQTGFLTNTVAAIWREKKFEPDKHCCSYLEREKSGFLLCRDQKMHVHNCQEKGK